MSHTPIRTWAMLTLALVITPRYFFAQENAPEKRPRGLHGYIGFSASRPPTHSEYSAGMGFTVQLGDGSKVTYSWYRFVDQPSFQQYRWSEAKKAALQSLVEKIHATWPIVTRQEDGETEHERP